MCDNLQVLSNLMYNISKPSYVINPRLENVLSNKTVRSTHHHHQIDDYDTDSTFGDTNSSADGNDDDEDDEGATDRGGDTIVNDNFSSNGRNHSTHTSISSRSCSSSGSSSSRYKTRAVAQYPHIHNTPPVKLSLIDINRHTYSDADITTSITDTSAAAVTLPLIRYDEDVRVILIPSRNDYTKAGINNEIWWNSADFTDFLNDYYNSSCSSSQDDNDDNDSCGVNTIAVAASSGGDVDGFNKLYKINSGSKSVSYQYHTAATTTNGPTAVDDDSDYFFDDIDIDDEAYNNTNVAQYNRLKVRADSIVICRLRNEDDEGLSSTDDGGTFVSTLSSDNINSHNSIQNNYKISSSLDEMIFNMDT